MKASPDKLLRGLEVGTRAGYLLLAGLGVFLLWRFFKGRGTTIVPLIPPAPRADETSLPEPEQATEVGGVVAGGLVSTVRAVIVEPAEGGRAYRRMFSSMFPATIEVLNQASTAQDAQIEVVIDFYELGGAERPSIRTRLETRRLAPGAVERIETELESGNFNSATFEFGQANAAARVYVNGKLTQGVTFEVW